MKLEAVEIRNMMGIDYLAFRPGSVTVIRGGNGTGKSSALKALSCIFEGGSDPGWLRRGSSQGSIVLTLDSGHTITKTIKHNKKGEIKCDLEIIGPDGLPVPAPQTFVNRLAESIDPGKILAIDASTERGRRELITLLLRLMPVVFTPEEITAACTAGGEILLAQEAAVDLAGLDKLKAGLTDKRRRIGIGMEEAQGTVQQLRKTLPEGDGANWRAKCDDLHIQQAKAVGELMAAQEAIREDARVQERSIYAEIEAAIEQLRKQRDSRIAVVNENRDTALLKNEGIARPVLDQLTRDITAAKERAAATEKAVTQKALIADFEKKFKDGRHAYDLHTQILQAIDDLKKKKLDSLPVQGLEFNGDRVLIDGTEWQHVNTARLVEVALQLTAAGSGRLPFLIVDDVEHLGRTVKTELRSAITAGGYQLIEAEVDPEDGPLAVHAIGEQSDGTLIVR